MTYTAYSRYFNAADDDFIEHYETFDTREEAEEWVAIQLDTADCIDAYFFEVE